MNKQPELTDQTRNNLLEAFWSFYVERRVDQITVKEIAAKAGYNRGTFYEYFRDVRDCLELIERRVLPSLDELPPRPAGGPPSPDPFESFVRLYGERHQYYDVLLGERGDPAFQRRLIDSVKATLRRAAPGGPDDGDLELDLALEYVLSGMIGVLRHCHRLNPQPPQAELMALVHRVVDGPGLRRLGERLGMPAPGQPILE